MKNGKEIHISKARVLIIDDDPDCVRAIELMLTGTRFSVRSAGLGEEGLTAAREHPPDVIIVDLMLPDLDGYSLCRRLRDNPETAVIPILIATSLQRDSHSGIMARIARHHRADAFLEKPLERKELICALERMLAEDSTSKELESAPPTALLVDDDPDFLDSTEKILADQGFEVYLAESGQEALKLARAFLPDVVLLDVMLPDQDGFSVCLELKKDPRTHPLPVLILSAVGEEFTVPEYAETIAREHMADDFASKPIRPSDLLDKIRRLIDRRRGPGKIRPSG